MREGLANLPWHRDCGMGGHAVMCPTLIASVFLTPATPETGDLRMLPGSWQRGCGPIDASHPQAPRGVSFAAAPGDVSLHYGDTMHAAPPPARDDLDTYRISAVTGFTRPGARAHRGRHYNEVLHRSDDGQIEHLAKVAEKAQD
jgi:ectoine hydroxylase-related dioxygenase (phytanoyl-CoA dioxygenase family)